MVRGAEWHLRSIQVPIWQQGTSAGCCRCSHLCLFQCSQLAPPLSWRTEGIGRWAHLHEPPVLRTSAPLPGNACREHGGSVEVPGTGGEDSTTHYDLIFQRTKRGRSGA